MPRQLDEDHLKDKPGTALLRKRKRIEDDDDQSTKQSTPQSAPQSPPRSPPRKRPGASSRVTAEAKAAAERRRAEREAEDRKEIVARKNDDLVSAHYNAVPERGRDWRKTDSQIRGLRSLNNWIKSTLIQKFSRPDTPTQNLLVLDVGCGKGGDLQKWQAAPQTPALYVGVDPADVSIEQAKSRYMEMKRRPRGRGRLFDAQFIVQDAYGKSLGGVPIIQQVGFDPRAGPDANGNITGRMMGGGFDVISMMFCLHYSYESEEKARGMLKNVAGALKKGGKFLGVLPNSDVISFHVEKHVKGLPVKSTPKQANGGESGGLNYDDEEDWNPEKPAATGSDDDWDPEKPSKAEDDEDDWDPEKPSTAQNDDDWNPEATLDEAPAAKVSEPAAAKGTPTEQTPLEWGNGIYTVKFPQSQVLPKDGVFRPPYGWKYFYYLEEAVNVPEYVVPWEGFRALAEDYGLELQYRKPFNEVWEEEKNDPVLGPLSERMGVRDRSGRFNVSPQEMEAASFYHAFCFYKI